MASPTTTEDLLDLKMLPAWANEPARANDYADFEGEDADEQGKQRDEREEDLVRDRTGEERAIVVREALNERSAARNRAG